MGRLREPAARETGPLQATDDVPIAAHRLPDEAATVVFDHGGDRSFIDPEVVDVEPALSRVDVSARHSTARAQSGIEGVKEAIFCIEQGTIAAAHLVNVRGPKLPPGNH